MALTRPCGGGSATPRGYHRRVHATHTTTLRGGSRVRRARDIRRTFDHGRSAASGPVVVYAVPTGGDGSARYGLVVGRKFGGAVVRNRIRRLLREGFRRRRTALPAGHDFLLLPRGPIEGLRAHDVARHVGRAASAAVRRYAAEGPREGKPDRGRRKKRKKPPQTPPKPQKAMA